MADTLDEKLPDFTILVLFPGTEKAPVALKANSACVPRGPVPLFTQLSHVPVRQVAIDVLRCDPANVSLTSLDPWNDQPTEIRLAGNFRYLVGANIKTHSQILEIYARDYRAGGDHQHHNAPEALDDVLQEDAETPVEVEDPEEPQHDDEDDVGNIEVIDLVEDSEEQPVPVNSSDAAAAFGEAVVPEGEEGDRFATTYDQVYVFFPDNQFRTTNRCSGWNLWTMRAPRYFPTWT